MQGFISDIASRVVPGQSQVFNHHFGGPAHHTGSTPEGATEPLQLLYVLDSQDPLVPVKIPEVRYIPLYFGMQYNASAMGYRVISDTVIEIQYRESTEYFEDFPYDNPPHEFPRIPVVLQPIAPEDYALLLRQIEIDSAGPGSDLPELSDEEQDQLNDLGYQHTQVGGVEYMTQGLPEPGCHNPHCKNFEVRDSLLVFAVIWNEPVPGVRLWDPDEEIAFSQLIYQICPLCQSISGMQPLRLMNFYAVKDV